MSRIRLAHTADLHLGQDLPFLGPAGPRRAQEKIRAFRDLLTICRDEGVQVLLIAGDFLEGSPPQSLVRTISQYMEEAGFLIFISPGNHDYMSLDSPYGLFPWPDNVHIFQGPPERMDFPHLKLSVYGAAFPSAQLSRPLFEEKDWARLLGQAPADDPDWVHIALMHGDLVQGDRPSLYQPIRPSSWPRGLLSYVGLGHIHKPSPVQEQGKITFAYSGTPMTSSFSNPGPQGFYLGWVDSRGAQMDRRILPGPVFLEEEVDLSDCRTREDLEDLLFGRLSRYPDYQKNYYRVYLVGKRSEGLLVNAGDLEKSLGEDLSYLEVVDRSSPALNPHLLVEEKSPEGDFTRSLLDLAGKEIGDLEEGGDGRSREDRVLRLAWKLGLEAIQKERDQTW